MASITLKGIKKVYPGDVVAVHDVDLEIEDKEFIVLVGPSGCGKSTTLRMIAGLEDISAGEMQIGGKRVNEIAPKDRDIAMVFQNYALYPHMTVHKNMSFGLRLRGTDKKVIEEKVQEAARILDISHLLNRKPKALSGGQRQRVALGRAMVRDPAVFLLDEPLSNLDAKLRGQMRTEITQLHRRLGTTFVYVTHDQTEAMTMGDRIVVMKDGYVQQVDTPQNLYDKPCNMFVAGFIGMPQMNFIPAKMMEKDGGFYVSFDAYTIPVPESPASAKLSDYVGKEVMLGIRPEDIYVQPEMLEKFSESTIESDVELAELMGAEIYLYTVLGYNKITVRAPSHTGARAGSRVRLALDNGKMHLFDTETKLAILR